MDEIKKPNFGECNFAENTVIAGGAFKERPEIKPLKIATLILGNVHIDVKIKTISDQILTGKVVSVEPKKELPPELAINDTVEFSFDNICNIKDS